MGHSYKGGSVPFSGGSSLPELNAPVLSKLAGFIHADLPANSIPADAPTDDNWKMFSAPAAIGTPDTEPLLWTIQGGIPDASGGDYARWDVSPAQGSWIAKALTASSDTPYSNIVTQGTVPNAEATGPGSMDFDVDGPAPGTWRIWALEDGEAGWTTFGDISGALNTVSGLASGFSYFVSGLNGSGVTVYPGSNIVHI